MNAPFFTRFQLLRGKYWLLSAWTLLLFNLLAHGHFVIVAPNPGHNEGHDNCSSTGNKEGVEASQVSWVLGVEEAGEADQEESLYTDTPIVHQFLKELNRESFGQDAGSITVDEMSLTTIANSIEYSSPGEYELSMVFNFHHLKVDYKDGEKWSKMPFDFMKLKELFTDWQEKIDQGGGWNALFFSLGLRSRSSSSQLQVKLPLHGQVVGGHEQQGLDLNLDVWQLAFDLWL